ncbi:hypothetical protein [Rhodopseudomonas sp. B29]|uniref:hypothetical protein n=1 Tax=Rhodopseudomonas sp. B29 TaxID=95607 RepID=UPI00131F20CD|nr:hypothetical protein [Rhodopseudomonas sp. B29]
MILEFDFRVAVMEFLGATKLSEVTAPKGTGNRVNTHVVSKPRERDPDFEAMNRVIRGGDFKKDSPDERREISQKR